MGRGLTRKLLIVGCGALGGCLAALLSLAADVTVYDRGESTRRVIRQRGIRLEEKKRVIAARVKVVDSLDVLAGRWFDLVIITAKAMDVCSAASEAARFVRARQVFLPQNGLFDFSWAGGLFKGAAICRGVTTMACREEGPGSVVLVFRGKVFAGGDAASRVAALFSRAGVSCAALRDSRRAVWAKLVFNSVMNALPVITGRGYGILVEDGRLYALVCRAIAEGKRLAAAEGVRLAFDPLRVVEGLRSGRYGIMAHMGSTYADVKAGRPTEMRFMLEVLLQTARRRRIEVPALEEIYFEFKLRLRGNDDGHRGT